MLLPFLYMYMYTIYNDTIWLLLTLMCMRCDTNRQQCLQTDQHIVIHMNIKLLYNTIIKCNSRRQKYEQIFFILINYSQETNNFKKNYHGVMKSARETTLRHYFLRAQTPLLSLFHSTIMWLNRKKLLHITSDKLP